MPSELTLLRARMVAAVVGLALVAVAFLVGVWAVFAWAFALVEVGSAPVLAAFVAAGALVAIGLLEYRQLDTIERLADAHPMDPEAAPAVYRTTTRVAAQLDVPVPTVAVSERRTPEAMAVGFRPDDVHLVLSLGTIESLETAELEAVVAHELAHVKNRDAMVMTVVSLPVVLADGLRARITRADEPGAWLVVGVPLLFLSAFVSVVGRAITAHFSRARERAADRAAAEAVGSPAPLASALRTLDHEIADTPTRDLREAAGVSSLSILPLEPRELETVMLGPEGETEPSYWWLRRRLHRLERRLFGTHPPTEARIERLSALEREVTADGARAVTGPGR